MMTTTSHRFGPSADRARLVASGTGSQGWQLGTAFAANAMALVEYTAQPCTMAIKPATRHLGRGET